MVLTRQLRGARLPDVCVQRVRHQKRIGWSDGQRLRLRARRQRHRSARTALRERHVRAGNEEEGWATSRTALRVAQQLRDEVWGHNPRANRKKSKATPSLDRERDMGERDGEGSLGWSGDGRAP